MTDVLKQLMPLTWNGVEIPISRMQMSVAVDLVEHKYWGVDGGHIEATGVAPIRYRVTAPFYATMFRSVAKTAKQLYPDQVRLVIKTFAQKATGVLWHPEFGAVYCKAERMEVSWDALRRSGCDAELSWVETATPSDVKKEDLTPVAEAEMAAAELDEQQRKVLANFLRAREPPQLSKKSSFADFMHGITGVVDQVGLAQARIKGRIDSVTYRVNRLKESVERVGNPELWKFTDSADRLEASLHDIKQKLHRVERRIALHYVAKDTTMPALLQELRDVTMADLIKLNPDAVSEPVIQAGTLIRYFKPTLAV